MNATLHRCLVACLIFFLVLPLASARIGETLDQCRARYGEPVQKVDDHQFVFHKGGLKILVQFNDGVADHISFARELPDPEMGHPGLSDDEIAVLLKSNGADQTWSETAKPTSQREWHTANGEILAYYSVAQPFLFIVTRVALERVAVRKKQEAQRTLDGF